MLQDIKVGEDTLWLDSKSLDLHLNNGPCYFNLREFITPSWLSRYSNTKIFWYLDTRLVVATFKLRMWFASPVLINTWKYGGTSSQRGLRDPYTEVGVKLSQHKFGKAVDFNVKGLFSDKVFKTILDNQKDFLRMGFTTMESSEDARTWTHLDIRTTGLNKINVFNV